MRVLAIVRGARHWLGRCIRVLIHALLLGFPLAASAGLALPALEHVDPTGRVTAVQRDAKGRLCGIDADLATQQWNSNTDPELAMRTGTIVPPPDDDTPTRRDAQGVADDASDSLELFGAESPSPRAQNVGREQAASPDGGPADSFHADRAANEKLKRVNGELDLAERLGILGRTEDMQRAAMEVARATQTALMRLPERLSPLLAAETDPVRCRALLEHELRMALDGLAANARRLAAA